MDAEERNREVADVLELEHPTPSDPGKQVARAYGVLARRRRAPARWTFYIGADGRIVYMDKAVIADGHGEEVPARLEALGIRRR